MEDKSSLDGIVNQDSRSKRILQSVLNELKLLPYEAIAAIPASIIGSKIGKDVSRQYFPVSSDLDKVLPNIAQNLQDMEFSVGGSVLLAVLALVGARYLGKYINKKLGAYNQNPAYKAT